MKYSVEYIFKNFGRDEEENIIIDMQIGYLNISVKLIFLFKWFVINVYIFTLWKWIFIIKIINKHSVTKFEVK